MEHFTPWTGLLGGLLIGLAAFGVYLFLGKICGLSGIAAGCLYPMDSDAAWRLSFLLGLLSGGLLLRLFYPQAFAFAVEEPWPLVALAGLLVGLGTRLGMGCTSGHGICGIGRLLPISFIATALFFGTALITATLYHGVYR